MLPPDGDEFAWYNNKHTSPFKWIQVEAKAYAPRIDPAITAPKRRDGEVEDVISEIEFFKRWFQATKNQRFSFKSFGLLFENMFQVNHHWTMFTPSTNNRKKMTCSHISPVIWRILGF